MVCNVSVDSMLKQNNPLLVAAAAAPFRPVRNSRSAYSDICGLDAAIRWDGMEASSTDDGPGRSLSSTPLECRSTATSRVSGDTIQVSKV